MSTQSDAPIRGSWEALLQEASRLATNYNDAAIPIFNKIYTRLQKMPRAQRHAANHRLQNIFMQAATNLVVYLTLRERYDEALAIIPVLEAEVSTEEVSQWEIFAAQILLQAGRGDESVARLRALAETSESDLEAWGELASVLLQLNRHEEADIVLARMDEWIDEHHDDDTEARRRDQGAVASLRASAALRTQDWDSAARWIDTAIALDEQFESRRALLAIELLRDGKFALADSFLAKVKQKSLRTQFWQGYSLWKQGEVAQAEAIWRSVAAVELQEDATTFTEYVLAHYYLGDKQSAGLSTVLGALNENPSQHWGLYFLAGLGWALRGNVKSAKADMETAMLQRRAGAEGRLLPYSSWLYVTDLVDETISAPLAGYFETSNV